MGPLARRELASRHRCSRRHRMERCVKSFGPSAYRMHASVCSRVGYRHGRGWLRTAFPTGSGPSSWEPDGSTHNGCHVFVDNQRYPRRVTTGRAVSRESRADSQSQSSALALATQIKENANGLLRDCSTRGVTLIDHPPAHLPLPSNEQFPPQVPPRPLPRWPIRRPASVERFVMLRR